MDTFDYNCCPAGRNMSCPDGNSSGRNMFPCSTSYAMAYIPFQQWGEVYSAEKGLSVGTLFPCLNLPFMGCMR